MCPQLGVFLFILLIINMNFSWCSTGIAGKIIRLGGLKIPEEINYEELASISTEGRQKLSKIKPDTIGQPSRISGVSSSDVSILIMYLGR